MYSLPFILYSTPLDIHCGGHSDPIFPPAYESTRIWHVAAVNFHPWLCPCLVTKCKLSPFQGKFVAKTRHVTYFLRYLDLHPGVILQQRAQNPVTE